MRRRDCAWEWEREVDEQQDLEVGRGHHVVCYRLGRSRQRPRPTHYRSASMPLILPPDSLLLDGWRNTHRTLAELTPLCLPYSRVPTHMHAKVMLLTRLAQVATLRPMTSPSTTTCESRTLMASLAAS